VPSPVPTLEGTLLPPGSSVTSAFVPPLRFTVPEGWVKSDDRPYGLRISPPGAGWLRLGNGGLPPVEFDGIGGYSRPLAGPPDGGTAPVAGVGSTAKDLATWLSTRPQLTSTKPIKVTLAGRTAYQLDFSLSAAAGGLCGMPCVNLLNSSDEGSASYQFGIEGPWKVRAILLDAPDGTTVMITLEDVDGNGKSAPHNRSWIPSSSSHDWCRPSTPADRGGLGCTPTMVKRHNALPTPAGGQ
jgi:hypothetical protein